MKYIIREKVSVKSGASAAVVETFSLGPWDTRAMAEEMVNDLARVDELDPNCAGSRGSARRGVTVVFEGESPKATLAAFVRFCRDLWHDGRVYFAQTKHGPVPCIDMKTKDNTVARFMGCYPVADMVPDGYRRLLGYYKV